MVAGNWVVKYPIDYGVLGWPTHPGITLIAACVSFESFTIPQEIKKIVQSQVRPWNTCVPSLGRVNNAEKISFIRLGRPQIERAWVRGVSPKWLQLICKPPRACMKITRISTLHQPNQWSAYLWLAAAPFLDLGREWWTSIVIFIDSLASLLP